MKHSLSYFFGALVLSLTLSACGGGNNSSSVGRTGNTASSAGDSAVTSESAGNAESEENATVNKGEITETAEGNLSDKKDSSYEQEKNTEDAASSSGDGYYKGDSFTLSSGGLKLDYEITDTGVNVLDNDNAYVYVCANITNLSDEQSPIVVPDFYADSYLIQDENPETFSDETSPDTTIKPCKKVAVKFYHYVDNPFNYDSVEADFDVDPVIIVDNTTTLKDSSGNTYYENGKLIGDPHEISGFFKNRYDDGVLSVNMISYDQYEVTISLYDGGIINGSSEYVPKSSDKGAVPGLNLTSGNISANMEDYQDLRMVFLAYERNDDLWAVQIEDEDGYFFDVDDYFLRCDEKTYQQSLKSYASENGSFDDGNVEGLSSSNSESNGSSHLYSDDDLLEMARIYCSFWETPMGWQVFDVDDDTVEIDFYRGNQLSEIFQIDPDTSDGYVGQGGTEPIHFANYSPEYFLIPYIGLTDYSTDDFRSIIENNSASKEEAWDFANRCINEVYARHGRIFTDENTRNYFESKPWYSGTVDSKDIDGKEEQIFTYTEYENYRELVNLRDEYSS